MSQRIGLCLAPLLPKILDTTLTLAGQRAAYWRGDYSQVAEANPLMRWVLEQHPLGFVAVSLVGMVFYAWLLYWMPRDFGKLVAFIIIFVHTYGAVSWVMVGLGDMVVVGCLPLIVGARWVLHWTWDHMDTRLPDSEAIANS